MRAVLDVNVLISAVLAPSGSPARIVRAWLDGKFELIISIQLLAELERALNYPKLRDRIGSQQITQVIEFLHRGAEVIEDPQNPLALSPDPDDDYLIALARVANALLVSGDGHLLGLADSLPIYSPSSFFMLIDDTP
ncbi:MAG: putative toxin-antitoxin system toxin component, PIN family [Actinobacteria bacterium]|nr:putative toxin-antitoxin system toxin component, PIN family [Actinomycetota bacterium]